MSEHKFTRKDWLAMLIVALVLVFAVWHLTTASQTLDDEAAGQVRFFIKSTYQRYYLTHRPQSSDKLAAILRQLNDVQLTEVNARGTAGSLVVEVLVKPMAAEPPGAAHQRYFHMHFTRFGGWQLDGEVSRLDWYLAVF